MPMNRIIKFRAWSDKDKKMYVPKLHEFEDMNVCIDNLASDQVTLMQFTGLLDRRGADIYEGDIVQGSWGFVDKIVYDTDFLQFRFDNGRSLDYYGIHKLEVKGNIYENPELLEK
jgi:uncharacterized phage protein (TIGR01671 family)